MIHLKKYLLVLVLVFVIPCCNKAESVRGTQEKETDKVALKDSASDYDQSIEKKNTDAGEQPSDQVPGSEEKEFDSSLYFENCPVEQAPDACNNGWCKIEPGTFILGSADNELPDCSAKYLYEPVQVTLTRPFLIQKYEVTQKQWEEMGFPNPARDVHPEKPVNMISWFEAAAFSNALSEKEGLETCYDLSECEGEIGSGCPDDKEFYEYGCWVVRGPAATDKIELVPGLYKCPSDVNVHKYEDRYDCPGYRLPTYAEWEYAARACTRTATYHGDILEAVKWAVEDSPYCETDKVVDEIAWHCGNSGGELQKVGQKLPNPWNLYDMLGNVYELIDYLSPSGGLAYEEGKEGPLVDPVGKRNWVPDGFFMISMIGGSYSFGACSSRAAYHFPMTGLGRGLSVGFRMVRTVFEEDK